MYPALIIANYFIGLSLSKREPITPMKLMKIVYFAHGWHLAVLKTPLLNEEIQAWDYGPVIPSVYHAFKKYGNNPIGQKCEIAEVGIVIDHDTESFLENIYDTYHNFTAIQLANLTHDKGTPWEDIFKQHNQKIPPEVIIPEKSITKYFEAELA